MTNTERACAWCGALLGPDDGAYCCTPCARAAQGERREQQERDLLDPPRRDDGVRWQ